MFKCTRTSLPFIFMIHSWLRTQMDRTGRRCVLVLPCKKFGWTGIGQALSSDVVCTSQTTNEQYSNNRKTSNIFGWTYFRTFFLVLIHVLNRNRTDRTPYSLRPSRTSDNRIKFTSLLVIKHDGTMTRQILAMSSLIRMWEDRLLIQTYLKLRFCPFEQVKWG